MTPCPTSVRCNASDDGAAPCSRFRLLATMNGGPCRGRLFRRCHRREFRRLRSAPGNTGRFGGHDHGDLRLRATRHDQRQLFGGAVAGHQRDERGLAPDGRGYVAVELQRVPGRRAFRRLGQRLQRHRACLGIDDGRTRCRQRHAHGNPHSVRACPRPAGRPAGELPRHAGAVAQLLNGARPHARRASVRNRRNVQWQRVFAGRRQRLQPEPEAQLQFLVARTHHVDVRVGDCQRGWQAGDFNQAGQTDTWTQLQQQAARGVAAQPVTAIDVDIATGEVRGCNRHRSGPLQRDDAGVRHYGRRHGHRAANVASPAALEAQDGSEQQQCRHVSHRLVARRLHETERAFP